jgi:hypothetical protein
MLGIGIDVQKIGTQEYLATGEQQPETTQVGNLIQDASYFCQGELALPSIRPLLKGDIAVLATHIAAKGKLKRAKNGDVLVSHPFMQPLAELTVSLLG